MHIVAISPYVYSLFDQTYGPTPGGAQRQQYLISKKLVNRGHEVSFLVGDFDQPKTTSVDDITLIKGAPTDVDGPFSIGTAAVRLLRAMRSTKADVFLVRGSPKLTAATYCCTRILRKPLIFRLANNSDIDPEYLSSKYPIPVRRLYCHAVRGAAAVMTQSRQQKKALNHEFGVNSRVVTNAYDLPPEQEVVRHSNRDSILWVGSSDPVQKKPHRFLNLAADIPNESFQMVSKPMPIDDGYHDQLRGKAEGIQNLEFVGEVSPDAVHDYYRNAKLLVNTSDYEGFPNTFLEAWRYETPVVSLYFDLDGILASNDVGIFSGNMDQLKRDIQQLGRDTDFRSHMGSSGRKLVAEQFSISRVARQYENMLTSIRD